MKTKQINMKYSKRQKTNLIVVIIVNFIVVLVVTGAGFLLNWEIRLCRDTEKVRWESVKIHQLLSWGSDYFLPSFENWIHLVILLFSLDEENIAPRLFLSDCIAANSHFSLNFIFIVNHVSDELRVEKFFVCLFFFFCFCPNPNLPFLKYASFFVQLLKPHLLFAILFYRSLKPHLFLS